MSCGKCWKWHFRDPKSTRKGLGDVIFKKIPSDGPGTKIKTCIQLRVIFSAKFDHSGTMADKIVSQTKLYTTPPSNQSVFNKWSSKWKTTSSLYQWHRKRNLSNEEAQCSFCAHEINVKWLRPLRRVEQHSLFKNWSES